MIERLNASATIERVDVDHGSVVYRSWGVGPPLLLVHGASGSWTHWVRNIDHLAATHRVIVPDLPGFGDSDDLPNESDADDLADTLAASVHAIVSGESFHLAGFSFGGIIAGLLARRLGSQVQRLILVSAGGIGMTARVAPVDDHGARAQLIRFMFADAATADDTTLRMHLDNVERTRFKSGSIPSSTLLLDALHHISVPVNAIFSDRDAFGGDDINERFDRLRQIRPDVDCHTIFGAGHWIPYEKPAQLNVLLGQIIGP